MKIPLLYLRNVDYTTLGWNFRVLHAWIGKYKAALHPISNAYKTFVLFLRGIRSIRNSQGAFHLMVWPVRPEFFSLYQWKDLVYVSQTSSENWPHSNVTKIFQSDRSEAQVFCVSFNNLTVLTGLAVLKESALSR
jgi:hypothetical protein